MEYKYDKNSFTCKKPEFFMAVCGYKNHSYMIIGVKDSVTQEQFVIGMLGRRGGLMGTFLTNERMPQNSQSLIDIQAFSISQNQYKSLIQFLKQMKISHKANAAAFAVPSNWLNNTGDQPEKDEVSFTWLSHMANSQTNRIEDLDLSDLDESTSYDPEQIRQGISLDNNCRTAAKHLTQATMNAESLPNVSSFFLRSLPFKAHLSQGIISDKLFIYPPPPPVQKKSENAVEWEILNRMYIRLDKIAKSASSKGMDESYKKFELLKTLYQQQYDKLTDGNHNLHDLMDDIKQYIEQEANAAIIDTPRNSFFHFKTSTRKMFEQIQKENPSSDSGPAKK
ncbi:hypothetical protein LEAN103870_13415 [Legionella anisa]|uniref:Uncharacterized protein n=1 Tax=Legionella anisa TaxID=28082 RepID=A0AAX0WUV9_9GAMM|nr:hypothetical protein [Legionella anisa]AWN74241.1 hypothetical protein DLD14_10510 [Legionella anisa]KTC72095.1 hypothetical protein Lani_1687 [Legionella anisa]MBN5934318.1 hypothetical protein [Legionella anisa]MCW8425727.1 hypothetical protein [Legionella anisa]MCW8448843.1 hypothetical protein [Legionella anisa]